MLKIVVFLPWYAHVFSIALHTHFGDLVYKIHIICLRIWIICLFGRHLHCHVSFGCGLSFLSV